MFQVRSSPTLDGGDFGWLKAKHHFAVTADGNPGERAARRAGRLERRRDRSEDGLRLPRPRRHGNRLLRPRGNGHAPRQHRKHRPHGGGGRSDDQRRNRHSTLRAQPRRRATAAVSDLAPPARVNGGEPQWDTRRFPTARPGQPIRRPRQRAARRWRRPSDPRRCARPRAPRCVAGARLEHDLGATPRTPISRPHEASWT